MSLRSGSGSAAGEEWLFFPPYTLVEVFSSGGVENHEGADEGEAVKAGSVDQIKKWREEAWHEVFGTKPVFLKKRKTKI